MQSAPSQTVAELLGSVEHFGGLTALELGRIVQLAQRRDFGPGEIVVQQGDAADSLHTVESGAFEVYIWDELLRVERPLQTLRRGDVFGEMGVLTNETRSASIRCQDSGSTIAIAADDYLKFLGTHSMAATALAKTLAHRLKAANRARSLQFERIANYTITPELVRLLPLKVILQYRMVPLSRSATRMTLGIVDPSDFVARNSAQAFLPTSELDWVCLAASDFDRFRTERLPQLAAAAEGTEPEEGQLTYPGEQGGSRLEDSQAARLLDECLLSAINSGASDLHFEPGFAETRIRARVDGRLITAHPPVKNDDYRSLVSRLRVLAGMDMTEHRRPQDGALRAQLSGRSIDLRLSVLPTPRGAAVVIRFQDSSRRERSLRSLVASETLAEWMEGLFMQPGGLVLVTGPTNSGKTTTLYGGIQMRLARDPTCKLITAEDPVEYDLDGVTQVQINERVGLSFPATLRSLLRQDPNVILIGEMRDRESVGIAVEAALTGHLVLSSLHTRTALETVTRLRQQGVEPFLIAAALRGVVSQRLVPKLCPACRQARQPDAETLARLIRAGLVKEGEHPVTWTAPGCSHCREEGIKGRVGVYEVLVISPALRAAIAENWAEPELLRIAGDGHFIPLSRYARYLLDQGLASAQALLALFATPEALPARLG